MSKKSLKNVYRRLYEFRDTQQQQQQLDTDTEQAGAIAGVPLQQADPEIAPEEIEEPSQEGNRLSPEIERELQEKFAEKMRM